MLFPLATFEEIDLFVANDRLARWEHKMGPLNRGNSGAQQCHALIVAGELVGVALTSSLIREHVGGGLSYMNRDNAVELSRLCASERWACRVVLRLWRELVFPGTGAQYAISYQDAGLHTGNTYRFDGWERMAYSSSGTDQRTGRQGRNKWIWVWKRTQQQEKAA
jgi:hypothetical protein